MKVSMEILEKAQKGDSVKIQRQYTDMGLSMKETREIQRESDFSNIKQVRYSIDNGITWSNYEDDAVYYKKEGESETLSIYCDVKSNKEHGIVARNIMERFFPYEHKAVYKKYWDEGILEWYDHTFVEISRNDGKDYDQRVLLSYEKEKGLEMNLGYHGTNIEITPEGKILTAIVAPLTSVANGYGIDVSKYAKRPVITKAAIVFVLSYEKKTGKWQSQPSRPIIISDKKSSRGMMEPNIIRLADGKYMLECRGSNAVSAGWDTRMKEGTPSYRWVAFSDDCIEFTQASPLTYENGEQFYSPSSISKWVRHSKNNKLYWLGNITPEIPDGNRPRYPLCLAEFDEKNKCLIKDSVVMVDQRRPGEGELIQFSNFSFYEDRVTGNIKIEYSRMGSIPGDVMTGDAIQVTVEI